MSKRMRAFGPAVHNRRKPSRKGIPQHFLGGVAVTGLVLGCAWTVYTNVFGASVYPTVSSTAFEAPVAKNPTVAAARPVRPAFNERFAAAAPQGEPSRSVAPQPVEATRLAEASPPAETSKAAQATKPAEAV